MHKVAPLIDVKAGPDDGLSEGQFVGYASIFGNRDSYGDVVQPGAFTETLAEWAASGDTLPVLWGHDMHDPFSNIGGVIEAVEDERGLKVTATLDLDDPKAAKVYRLLKGKRVNQMSFAYDVVEGHWVDDDDGDYYSLEKLKLYEVSIVPIGANQETEILAVKHLTDAIKSGRAPLAKTASALIEARAAIDSALAAMPEGENDQEKASDADLTPAVDAPDGEKSAMGEVKRPSARALAAKYTIDALAI